MKSIRYYINLIQESELIEPEIDTKTVQNLNVNKLRNFQDKNLDKDETSGTFAYAKDVDPHQIKLTSYLPTDINQDSKYQYIQAIKPLMGSNPYVPNVYEIKLVKAKNLPQEEQKSTYLMQKLVNWIQVPPLSLYAACIPVMKSCNNESTDTDLIDRYNELKREYKLLRDDEMQYDPNHKNYKPQHKSTEHHFKRELAYLMADYLEYLFADEITSNDSQLTEVMNIISELFKNSWDQDRDLHLFTFDLHTNNFMFRPSPYGYQLVITDPLA